MGGGGATGTAAATGVTAVAADEGAVAATAAATTAGVSASAIDVAITHCHLTVAHFVIATVAKPASNVTSTFQVTEGATTKAIITAASTMASVAGSAAAGFRGTKGVLTRAEVAAAETRAAGGPWSRGISRGEGTEGRKAGPSDSQYCASLRWPRPETRSYIHSRRADAPPNCVKRSIYI